MRPLASLAVVAALVGALGGCFRVTTTYVRVRDPAAVTLRSGSAELLPAGREPRVASAAVGHYWYLLSKRPYRIEAVRGRAGELTLRCEECGRTPWPMWGFLEVPLVDAAGVVRPTLQRPVLTREALAVTCDVGLLYAPRQVLPTVGLKPTLVIPWGNVAEARQVKRPLPWWAAGLGAVVGAGWVAGGAAFVAVSDKLRTSVRAGIGAPVITIGAALLGTALWHLLAPERVEVLRRPP